MRRLAARRVTTITRPRSGSVVGELRRGRSLDAGQTANLTATDGRTRPHGDQAQPARRCARPASRRPRRWPDRSTAGHGQHPLDGGGVGRMALGRARPAATPRTATRASAAGAAASAGGIGGVERGGLGAEVVGHVARPGRPGGRAPARRRARRRRRAAAAPRGAPGCGGTPGRRWTGRRPASRPSARAQGLGLGPAQAEDRVAVVRAGCRPARRGRRRAAGSAAPSRPGRRRCGRAARPAASARVAGGPGPGLEVRAGLDLDPLGPERRRRARSAAGRPRPRPRPPSRAAGRGRRAPR